MEFSGPISKGGESMRFREFEGGVVERDFRPDFEISRSGG